MNKITIQIRKELAALDVKNPQHWTADDLPRLDVIRQQVNNDAITRQDIGDASPGFTRLNPNLTDSANTGKKDKPKKNKRAKNDPNVRTLSDEQAARDKVEQANKNYYEAKEQLAIANGELDKIVIANERDQSSRNLSNDIKHYQAAQQKIRAQLNANKSKV